MVHVLMVSIDIHANVKKIIWERTVKQVSCISSMLDNVTVQQLFRSTVSFFSAGINECDEMPCLNGGKCVDLGDVKLGDHYYKCVCKPGFTGKNCETNINECDPSPCLNGGHCVDGVNDYTCKCPAGYTGKDCETSKSQNNNRRADIKPVGHCKGFVMKTKYLSLNYCTAETY